MKLIHLVILLLAVYKGNNNRDLEAFLVTTTLLSLFRCLHFNFLFIFSVIIGCDVN